MLAECLHAAVARAVSRTFPMFRDLRSQLVLFNCVPGGLPQQYQPRDAVGRIFEYCATGGGLLLVRRRFRRGWQRCRGGDPDPHSGDEAGGAGAVSCRAVRATTQL
jgi:hypothetical protein